MFAVGFASGMLFSFVWGAVLLRRHKKAAADFDRKIRETAQKRLETRQKAAYPQSNALVN